MPLIRSPTLQTWTQKKIGKAAVARKALKDILDRREETGKFSWTLCLFPTAELAKQAGLPMARYVDQVIKACYLDRKDPWLRGRRLTAMLWTSKGG